MICSASSVSPYPNQASVTPHTYIIRQPVILQRVNILFHHYALSAPDLYKRKSAHGRTHIVYRSLLFTTTTTTN